MSVKKQNKITSASLPIFSATLLLVAGLFFLTIRSALANSVYQVLPFSQDWTDAGLITVNDDWSGVGGIIGYLGDYTLSSPTGVDPQTLLADYTTVAVDVIANQTNPNTLTAGGVAEFDGIADRVVAMQGSGTADAPFLLVHLNTTGLRNIRVRYNVRDVDGAVDNAVQQVALHYRVGSSGNFTNLPGGYVADATTGPSLATLVTPIDVTLPSAANNQPVVQIRIMTTNAIGSDEWVGIDDLIVTGEGPGFTLSKAAPGIVMPGETFTYTLAISNEIFGTATNVILTDTLPANTTFVSASDGGVYAGGVIQWTVLSLADGELIHRSFQAQATSTAGITIANDDYQMHASNFITPTTGAGVSTFVSPLDLSIGKTSPVYALGGDTFEYGIQLNFTSMVTADQVLVTDTLPANVSYVSDTSGINPTFPSAGVVVWDFGDVATSTEEIVYTLTVIPSISIPNNSTITNQVEVSTNTFGDPTNNNTAQAHTVIYQIVPIATARAGASGQIFAIEGQVTYLPGTFSANDWALQDDSGGIVGYFAPPPSVALGDHVRLVAGRLDYAGQEEIGSPFLFFENLGPGVEVTPLITTTGSVGTGDTEGWLVHISGLVSGLGTCSTTANYNFYVDDGSGFARIFMDRDVGLDVCAMGAENGKMIHVTGFSSRFDPNYEVRPRRANDIDVAANHPAISKQAPSTVAPSSVFTYTISVENRMGLTLTNVTVVDNLPANVSSAEGSTIIRSLGTLVDRGQIDVSFPVTATDQVTVVFNSSYFVTATEFTTPTYGTVATTFVVSGSLQIHDIQGPGHSSPFVGQTVEGIQGVVTMRLSSGFYMQDITPDANPDTSEGIYIFTGGAPSVLVGDDVSLNGLVVEYNGMTELSGISGLVIHMTGIGVPPTSVSLPVPVGTDLEPYESMLVVFPQALTASQNYFQGRYGQVTLSDGRMYNPTNGNGLGDTVELNLRRMIVLDDGLTTQYPNPIPYIGQDNTLRVGDTVTSVTGIVDYGLITSDSVTRYYRLQPTIPPVFTRVNERTAAPEEVGGSLNVASMNVLNYFNGDGMGGGFPTPRGATTYVEFVRQRTKIIAAITALNADVVGLMEIENDGDDAFSAIQDLINGLNDATAPGTYTFISEPAPGTDQIKVAMIYKPGAVTPVGAAINYQVDDHPVYQPLYDRPPLVQLFSANSTGETFFVIVNHFKSKGSCPSDPTDPDAEYGQGCWNVKRVAQANGLLDLIAELEAATGDPDAMIIGDMNSYGEEDPILALTTGGMVNELAARVPVVERYSYIFDGQSGYLDHALATSSLDEQISDTTIWHVNADEPEIINYQTGKPQDLYTPTAYRSSDHDPVLAGLDLRPAVLGISHTVFPELDVDLGGVVTYTVILTNQADVTAFGIVVTDALPTEVTFDGWVVQNGAAYADGFWSWSGDLPAGGAIAFVYTAILDANTSLYDSVVTNVVHFISTNDGSGSSPATFYVVSPPVLGIEKLVEFANNLPAPGDWITYTVNVENQGPSTAWDVHITDTLPDGLIGADVNVTVTIPAVSVYEVVIPAMLEPDYALYGTTVTNTAAYECPGVSSGTAAIAFDVVEAPVLSILKTVDLMHDPALPGDPLTYTVVLSNESLADAVGVHIMDVLPVEVTGSDVDITVTVPADGNYVIDIPATLSEEVVFGAVITNTASFSYMEAVSGKSAVALTVVGAPVLSMVKEVELSRDPIQPGDALTYTITVANAGPADAIGVHLTDVLPAEVDGMDLDVTIIVPAHGAYTAVVQATLAEDAAYDAEVINTANYLYKGLSGQAEISFIVAGTPDLSVEKTVDLSRIPTQPGDPITYTITIVNLGESDAIDVVILDVLPEEVVGLNVSVTVTIPADGVYEIVIPATVSNEAPNGAVVNNTVIVIHPSGDVSDSVSFQVTAWMRMYLPLIYRGP
jgi:uncharacterized repeat protein (TIGR01451 family)